MQKPSLLPLTDANHFPPPPKHWTFHHSKCLSLLCYVLTVNYLLNPSSLPQPKWISYFPDTWKPVKNLIRLCLTFSRLQFSNMGNIPYSASPPLLPIHWWERRILKSNCKQLLLTGQHSKFGQSTYNTSSKGRCGTSVWFTRRENTEDWPMLNWGQHGHWPATWV